MRVLRGLLLVGAWVVTVACSQRFGDSGWFAVVAVVTVVGAWGVGLWDASSDTQETGR